MNENDILNLLQSVVSQPALFALLIILTTFILEDLAITTAAIITAQTDILVYVPLAALFTGIVLGDIGLYFIGKYSSRISYLEKFKDNNKIQKASKLLEKNLILTILISRFMPGMRLPTYMAIGAFNISFKRFLTTVLFAVGLWSGSIFYLFYIFGDVAKDMMGALKWCGLGFLIFTFVFGPKIFNYFSQQENTNTSA
jgi:membrane protein DedA with SNARE-associated domain